MALDTVADVDEQLHQVSVDRECKINQMVAAFIDICQADHMIDQLLTKRCQLERSPRP